MSSTLQIQTDPKLENVFAHISYDAPPTVNNDGSVDGDWDERKTNADGYTAFMFVEPRRSFVLVRAPGYRDAVIDVEMPHDDLITVALVKAPKTLSPLLWIDPLAHRMVNQKNERVYGRMASGFLLYKKHLDGLDIDPVLDQLESLGCNMVRIMGMFESLGGFNPKAYGDRYYGDIPAFMERLERRGMYGMWTCCAATGVWMTEGEAVQHVGRTVEVMKLCPNALVSPVNEQGQHVNSINLQRVKNEVDFGWLLHDMGSYGEDLPCEAPFGTHAVLHTTRRYPGSVKDGNIVDHPNHVAQHLDVGIDEPVRFGDEGSGDFHTDPRVAREAAGSAYTALFWCFHSMQGERGDMLTGNTLECARAAFDAMKGH